MDKKKKAKAIDDLKILYGLPPHDVGGNICLNDGYYAISLEKQYVMSISELIKETGFDKIQKQWHRTRKRFITITTKRV